MKETLKVISECVFSKHDKVKRLNKLDNLRKLLCSEFEILCDNSINLFELIDDFSLIIFDKETNVGNDPISIHNDRNKGSVIINEFNELRNSILSILVERSIIVFHAQWFF